MSPEAEGPWKDWIPGVLNDEQLTELCKLGFITRDNSNPLENAIDYSSIDLYLSDEGFEMTNGAVKPGGPDAYDWFIKRQGLAQQLPKAADRTFSLKAKKTYVFKLQEKLDRRLAAAGIYGQATAKSTVGRVDVLARLIVDGIYCKASDETIGEMRIHYAGLRAEL
jgi:hypothetical protein